MYPDDYDKETCAECSGTGKIFKKNGRQIKCYECDGYGFFWVKKKGKK